jgi:uncharacterized repeat protein (TIGR01451 family)
MRGRRGPTAFLVLALMAAQMHVADAVVGPVADISMLVRAEPQAVVPGDVLDIGIGLRNNGPFDAKNVTMRTAIPAHTTFVSMSFSDGGRGYTEAQMFTPPPGGTGAVNACVAMMGPADNPMFSGVGFTLRVRVDANVAQGETIVATATVPSVRTADALWCPTTSHDPVPENNTSTATATASGPADVSVAGSASPDPVLPGSDLTYTLDVRNAGPYDAENVTFTDWYGGSGELVSFTQESGPAFTVNTVDPYGLRKITGSIPRLAAGSSARFIVVVSVRSTVTSAWLLHNILDSSSGTGDPDRGNNRVTVRCGVAEP